MCPLRAFVGVVALAAVARCSRQTPTSPPPPTVAPIQVTNLTISGLEGPLVAGSTPSLRATAHLSDGTDFAVNEGAQWTSQNPDVVRVDARGTLDALREGQTTINVTVKGASATLPVTVVMNVTGVWSLTFVPLSCRHFGVPPGCTGRHPRPTQETGRMVLSQAGDQVSAVWFDNWNVPIEGRITPDGRLVLNGRHCFTLDHAPDTEISVCAEMERAPGTDSFRGRAFWENYNTICRWAAAREYASEMRPAATCRLSNSEDCRF